MSVNQGKEHTMSNTATEHGKLPNSYDTMRFLRAGVGSSVVGTGLTLRDILWGHPGVTLVYETEDGQRVHERLALTRLLTPEGASDD